MLEMMPCTSLLGLVVSHAATLDFWHFLPGLHALEYKHEHEHEHEHEYGIWNILDVLCCHDRAVLQGVFSTPWLKIARESRFPSDADWLISPSTRGNLR